MQNRQDMEQELAIRLMAANNSSNFGSARITKLIQDAELWATSLHFWPSLQRARTTYTEATHDYYDYPEDFLTGSITRLYVDGKKYDQKNFQDFRDYVDNPNEVSNTPDPTKRYFANYGRQYFIWPVPSTNGTDNLVVWGNVQSPGLPAHDSTTIFSLWDDSGNEAIVDKAFSVALKRIAPQEAISAEAHAISLLGVIFKRVSDQLQKDQRLNHPFFNVLDMFGGGFNSSPIGNFSISGGRD